MKIIKIELNEEQEKRFSALKARLGLGADAEVARYSINETYLSNVEKRRVQEAPAEARS